MGLSSLWAVPFFIFRWQPVGAWSAPKAAGREEAG